MKFSQDLKGARCSRVIPRWIEVDIIMVGMLFNEIYNTLVSLLLMHSTELNGEALKSTD